MLLLSLMLVGGCFLSAAAAAPLSPAGSLSDEEMRKLLEKSLSIVEIDNELERIEARRSGLDEAISLTKEKLIRQEQDIEKQRETAGRVLRSYYTGEHAALMSAMLSFRSFNDLLATMDYIELLFGNDRQTLDDYAKQYDKLLKAYKNQEKEKREMNDLTAALIAQKERLSALQHEVDAEVNGSANAEQLRLLIEELGNLWNTTGIYEVKRYFKALAEAMNNLPQWMQDNPGYLQADGLSYSLKLPDTALNEFLVSQNELFRNFTFTFDNGTVTASGQEGSLNVSVSGHYSVVDEPKNGLMFHIDKLLFNGLELPDTTRRQTESEFDLGFYPGQFISFLKVVSVEVEDGNLLIKLSVSL
ncbi:hypothetical protein VN24_19500 [Paenibacillus beijingensis]|uniref:Uncharacterized protein n=2 Tax=Paenibacillus beijingensis TaxID=1126833 RepID=A0A0D5NSH5_9BACL|nr:hypothetical protein VN24_19500 [Paenibacillus beijingensis]